MDVAINSQGFSATPSLREYAVDRVHKSCDHLAEPPARCRVHLGKTGSEYRVELDLRYQGRDFSANSKGADLRAAITSAAGRLRRQLENYTTKANSRR